MGEGAEPSRSRPAGPLRPSRPRPPPRCAAKAWVKASPAP